ncbi:hypothetical protein C1645_877272 [Glomus cerebriforme]|uniref:Uncharacterized protein n=1 Tax=Glomus cerebriforme TaxID=658196 RepID=A0A397SSD7_9GLOM|nr:hypothetical protein C1645_877272 [Glomus cerebriforme]
MSLACHCHSCNVDYPAVTYPSLINKDKQGLILQICKEIFEAIQNEYTSAEIFCTMLHGQIRNIYEIENYINEEFGQLFRNNILHKEIKSHSIGTWKIDFNWNKFYKVPLIRGLLKISREWYDPFTNHLQEIDHQKRNKWLSDRDISINEGKLKQHLLDNLKNYLPGFEYLFEYSWESYDGNNRHEGDFIFASDSGVFIVVEVKWLNVKNGTNVNISRKDAVRTQALKYKNKASEKFNGKYITLIGAIFTNNLDENSRKKVTFEFIDDNDEIIVQNLEEIDDLSRRNNELQAPISYNNRPTFPAQVQEEDSPSIPSISVAGAVAGIAAAAAVGYVVYTKVPMRTVAAAGSAIYKVYQDYQEFSRNNDINNINDSDRFQEL